MSQRELRPTISTTNVFAIHKDLWDGASAYQIQKNILNLSPIIYTFSQSHRKLKPFFQIDNKEQLVKTTIVDRYLEDQVPQQMAARLDQQICAWHANNNWKQGKRKSNFH